MFDPALIQQCADPKLKPAIVEQFIARVGISDPLTITVRSGSRTFLVPQPKTPEEAVDLMREHVGSAVVRAGITQYPAGLGLQDKSQLTTELVEPCANIKIGTSLFGKVYRIVVKWYGAPAKEAFEDAIIAYQSGEFEGKSVFREPDPGDLEGGKSKLAGDDGAQLAVETAGQTQITRNEAPTLSDEDPGRASIRIDLSGIKEQNKEK